MAIKKKSEDAPVNYDIKVTKAREFEGNKYAFDMVVNGVTIYGCWYRTCKRKDGTEFNAISFPSRKGTDGEYYNHCYFKITEEMLDTIEEQIGNLI